MAAKKNGYIGFALLLVVVFGLFITGSLTSFFDDVHPVTAHYRHVLPTSGPGLEDLHAAQLIITPIADTQSSENSTLVNVVKGQGKNYNPFGSRQLFIDSVSKKEPSLNSTTLGQIFDYSYDKVNPLFVVALWGAESNFANSPDPFGNANTCAKNQPNEFLQQLSCIIFELSGSIQTFEKDNGGHNTGLDHITVGNQTFYYTTEFTYALGKYFLANEGTVTDSAKEQAFIDYVKKLQSQ